MKSISYQMMPPRELIKTKRQIEKIKDSCKINIEILDFISEHVKAGISTGEIDRLIYQKTKQLGGIPAPLNYNGFPNSVCTSINEEVCHGIPSDQRVVKDGDIINVDVSTEYKSYFSDSSRMFCVGNVSSAKKKLVHTAKECMEQGILQVKPGGFLGDVGQAVSDHAKKNGYSVVREIGGHGIGLEFHEEPFVSYVTKAKTGIRLVPGLIFTVEPMINMGTSNVIVDPFNGWTVYTKDRKPSAQWEKMVMVTEHGCEVLSY